jgi:hypothetical protein
MIGAVEDQIILLYYIESRGRFQVRRMGAVVDL